MLQITDTLFMMVVGGAGTFEDPSFKCRENKKKKLAVLVTVHFVYF